MLFSALLLTILGKCLLVLYCWASLRFMQSVFYNQASTIGVKFRSGCSWPANGEGVLDGEINLEELPLNKVTSRFNASDALFPLGFRVKSYKDCEILDLGIAGYTVEIT